MNKKAVAEKLQTIESNLQGATAFIGGIRLMLEDPDPSCSSDVLRSLKKDMDTLKERLGYAGDRATEIQRLITRI